MYTVSTVLQAPRHAAHDPISERQATIYRPGWPLFATHLLSLEAQTASLNMCLIISERCHGSATEGTNDAGCPTFSCQKPDERGRDQHAHVIHRQSRTINVNITWGLLCSTYLRKHNMGVVVFCVFM